MKTVSNITVNGYFDSDNNKAHSGALMKYCENLGSWKYFNTGWPFINIIKGSQLNALSGGTNVGNKFFDTTGGGTWRQIVVSQNDGQDIYFPTGDWICRWVGTCATSWNWSSATECTDNADQTDNLIAGQTEADFDNSPTTEGTFAGGSGHNPNDVITLTSGVSVKVHTVSSGAVVTFTIDESGDAGAPASGDSGSQAVGVADTQFSTTGTGTGFSVTPDDLNIIHRRTYTVAGAQPIIDGTGDYQLTMSNGTCTRLELLQPGNETRFDEGKIMASQWITDQDGVEVFRTMGWQETNGSPFRTHTDANQMDDCTWGDKNASVTGQVPYRGAVPLRACIEACNEAGNDLWCNVPHQYTDAAVTAFANEINDHLDGNVYIEYGNETWNSAGVFKDAFRFTGRLSNTTREGTVVNSTATVTSNGHGLSTGDRIICFNNPTSTGVPKNLYTWGERPYVIVDDANTFRFATTYDAAFTRGNDVTVSGDADYVAAWDTATSSFHAEFDHVRFKADSPSGTQTTNHATRSAEVWTLCKAVLGSKMYAVGAGQRTNTGVLDDHMAVAEYRAKIDYASVASYYRVWELSGAERSWNRVTFVKDNEDETNYNNTGGNGDFDGGTDHAVSDVITLGWTFTANVSDDELDGISFMSNGHPIEFATTGTLPAPLQTGTTYYVQNRNQDQDHIQVSATVTGDPITITTTGSGTHSIAGGVEITVDAVSSGVVTQFTVDASNDTGWHKSSTAIEQISTTGSGTGFTLTPEDDNINVDPTVTLTDFYNFLKDINGPTVLQQQQNNINIVNRDILINYEGDDHHGSATWTYGIPSIGTLMTDWGDSTERQTWTEEWVRELSGKSILIYAHHVDYSQYDTKGLWGRFEHQGDSDSPPNLAIDPMLPGIPGPT